MALEVARADVGDSVRFWTAMGFTRTATPEPLREHSVWFERKGTQIHLLFADEPVPPPRGGHPAVVVADFDEAVERLETAGFPVERRAPYWGECRGIATMPGGQRVELMAAPPESTVFE